MPSEVEGGRGGAGAGSAGPVGGARAARYLARVRACERTGGDGVELGAGSRGRRRQKRGEARARWIEWPLVTSPFRVRSPHPPLVVDDEGGRDGGRCAGSPRGRRRVLPRCEASRQVGRLESLNPSFGCWVARGVGPEAPIAPGFIYVRSTLFGPSIQTSKSGDVKAKVDLRNPLSRRVCTLAPRTRSPGCP